MAPTLLYVKVVQLSRFVLTLRDVAPGEHVLYDVVADRYVGVDDASLGAIERWRTVAPAGAEEREGAEALRQLGVLVRDAAEDEARLAAHAEEASEGLAGTAYVTLMPTLSCELACGYCFQKDHPAAGRMSAETEAAALSWIERRTVASGARRLLVSYIGGEPLLRKDFLLRTARALSAALGRRGVAFAWEITTNGVALEPGLLHELCACGPGAVKVTLDGDRATHDRARPFRDGRGSFDVILERLVKVARACPEVALRLGGNLPTGAAASCERLLDRLVEAGLTGRFEWIRFKPIIDTGGCGTACGATQAQNDALSRRALERGLAQTAPIGVDAVSPCELHWKRSWVVDPAGRVYKCLAVAGRPELALGTVRGEALAGDPLVADRPWERCGACPLVPVCKGGCLGGRYLQIGKPGEPQCDRPVLEARFRAEVARRYLEEFHPGAIPPAPAVNEAASEAA